MQVLVAELGPDWQSKLAEFDFQPLAAASIGQVGVCSQRGSRLAGFLSAMPVTFPPHPPTPLPVQVHSALLHDGRRAVMKIQVGGSHQASSPWVMLPRG